MANPVSYGMIRLQTIHTTGGFMNPAKILENLDIKKGSKVADFGCGAGYFTTSFAKVVGNSGRVYAIDILESALESVKGRAKLESILNIETHRGNLEKQGGSGLGDKSVDIVMMANILFQSELKDDILKEAKRVLKKTGKIVISEWKDDVAPGEGFMYRVSKEELKKLAKDAGLVLEKEFDAGGSHYGLVFSL